MNARLSDEMCRALSAARDGGDRRLYRWPGGYWFGRAKALSDPPEQPPPGRYYGTQTVHALIERGMLSTVAHLKRGDAWIVELTEEAWKLMDPSNAP
jgi:hypothetical protein